MSKIIVEKNNTAKERITQFYDPMTPAKCIEFEKEHKFYEKMLKETQANKQIKDSKTPSYSLQPGVGSTGDSNMSELDVKLSLLVDYGYKITEQGVECEVVRQCNRQIFRDCLRIPLKTIITLPIHPLNAYHRMLLVQAEQQFIDCIDNPDTF